MRFVKNTQRDTSKVLRLPRKMTMDTSKVLRLPRKRQHILWKRRKSIAPATQNDFRHVTKHIWMSRSATPATRNEATTRLKPPKRTTSAELPIGTAIRGSRGRLRTVADGCARERNVERTHPQPPDPQSETGTFATHSGIKMVMTWETYGKMWATQWQKQLSFGDGLNPTHSNGEFGGGLWHWVLLQYNGIWNQRYDKALSENDWIYSKYLQFQWGSHLILGYRVPGVDPLDPLRCFLQQG